MPPADPRLYIRSTRQSGHGCPTEAPSLAHQRAVVFPEATDRCFAGPEVLRLSFMAAHHNQAGAIIVVLQCALHETADAAILHGDIARCADQIALTQSPFGHRLVVRVETKMDPLKLR